RSQQLGDRTEEVAEIVKGIYEDVDKIGEYSEAQVIDILKDEYGINIKRGVLRKLKELKSLKCLKEISVPEMCAEQMVKRFLFVHDKISKGEDFKNWIWSDESVFSLRSYRRFITTSNKFDKRRLTGVKKFPTRVMFWACITWDGPGPIVFLEQGETVDGPTFLGIIDDFLLPFVDAWIGRTGRNCAVFQQDGAPGHTSRATLQQLSDWNLEVPLWPPSSPDCNPIEYCWKDLKCWVRKNINPKTAQEIMDGALFYWTNVLTKERCRAHIKHSRRNMEIIHKVNGAPIVDKWRENN
ncbi:hypothetical protein PENTCL1PPCAC_12988, partial [Pristionchus entomophagus]